MVACALLTAGILLSLLGLLAILVGVVVSGIAISAIFDERETKVFPGLAPDDRRHE